MGAKNISKYIPEDTYIALNDFSTKDDLLQFVNSISEEEYEKYIKNINDYICSESFERSFSTNEYIRRIIKIIIQ